MHSLVINEISVNIIKAVGLKTLVFSVGWNILIRGTMGFLTIVPTPMVDPPGGDHADTELTPQPIREEPRYAVLSIP